MDYDKTRVLKTYDAGRGYTPEQTEFWLNAIAAVTRRSAFDDILDLGCGTGRYAAPLAERFGARIVALDPSVTMLAEAERKSALRVRFLRGSGEAIPLADASVDLVFMSMVFHHFDDPARVLTECRRVLRAGGLVCLRAVVRDRIDDYPYVRFFPASGALMRTRFWTVSAVERGFSAAGFELVEHQIVRAELAASWSIYAEKIATRSDSCLAQLPNEEFAAGLRALRDHARATPGVVTEPVDLFAFRRI